MQRLGLGVGFAAIGLLAAAGAYAATRGDPTHDVVTPKQAASALESLYDARADHDALCVLATSNGNCRVLLRGAGDAPGARPEIVCTVVYEGDATHSAGLIVRIRTEGTHSDTEVLVLSDDGEPRYMNPVYWGGARFSAEGVSRIGADFACE